MKKDELEADLIKVSKEIGEIVKNHWSIGHMSANDIINDGRKLSELVEEQNLIKLKLEGKHYD